MLPYFVLQECHQYIQNNDKLDIFDAKLCKSLIAFAKFFKNGGVTARSTKSLHH